MSGKKPKKVVKLPAPKRAKKKAKANIGHNSNSGVNKPLIKIFEQYESLAKNAKEIGKAQRDLKAKAKEEHGVQTKNFTAEIALRKLDSDVRTQFEQGQKDLQDRLGYKQLELALDGDEAEGGA